MKKLTLLFVVTSLLGTTAFAEGYPNPVAKARLAVGSMAAKTLKASESNSVDAMCFYLGRFSAILMQLADSSPAPAKTTTSNASAYSAFCGGPGTSKTGRGSADNGAVAKLVTMLNADVAALNEFVKANAGHP